MIKAIFGSLVGLCLFIFILLIFHKPIVERYVLDIKPDTISKLIVKQLNSNAGKADNNEAKISSAIVDERIVSLNKRFDDFYILATIIITLLLAINIGIFINIDSRVKSYFEDTYEESNKKIAGYKTEAAALFSDFQARVSLTLNEVEKSSNKLKEPTTGIK